MRLSPLRHPCDYLFAQPPPLPLQCFPVHHYTCLPICLHLSLYHYSPAKAHLAKL